MIDDRDLDAAVTAGILDAATRERLVLFTRDLQRGGAGPDEERFRLLTGFNDIFVSIAIGLLLFAVASLTGTIGAWAAPAAVAATSWTLAEYFTRRRRMALPSILLLLAFVGAAFAAGTAIIGGSIDLAPSDRGFALLTGGLLAAAAAFAHWRRFMVPITVAAGALAVSVCVIVLLGSTAAALGVNTSTAILAVVAACGLAVFALAMWFDSRDPARLTRRTDVAFWLHLLAAPMIIHPVFAATGLLDKTPAPGAAVIVVLVYLALTVVALAIDRRALLVSALGYVIYAVRTLIDGGGGLSTGFAATALIIGLFLVLLSAAWRPVRSWVLAALPPAVRDRLPHAAV